MARLSAATRRSMPQSEFAGPNKTYPDEDRTHAVLAKAMADKYASGGLRKRIDAKANAKLGEKSRGDGGASKGSSKWTKDWL